MSPRLRVAPSSRRMAARYAARRDRRIPAPARTRAPRGPPRQAGGTLVVPARRGFPCPGACLPRRSITAFPGVKSRTAPCTAAAHHKRKLLSKKSKAKKHLYSFQASHPFLTAPPSR
ncbi:hypothetical protein ANK1_3243 [plant metagenome]|uniref:Uncharacterized protein n=1 Tax=plant metagenome TaxID=1297885 RepID=A0A484SM13_9ZZZZ